MRISPFILISLAACGEGELAVYGMEDEPTEAAQINSESSSPMMACLDAGGAFVLDWDRDTQSWGGIYVRDDLLALRDDGLSLWELDSGLDVAHFSLDASPMGWHGNAIIAPGSAGLMQLEVGETEPLQITESYAQEVASNGDLLAVSDWSSRVSILRGSVEVASLETDLDSIGMATEWTGDGRLVVAGMWGPHLRIEVWEAESGVRLGEWTMGTRCGGMAQVGGLSLGMNGKRAAALVSAGGYGPDGADMIYTLDLVEMTLLAVEPLEVTAVSLAEIPSGEAFAVLNTDGVTTLWDFNGTELYETELGESRYVAFAGLNAVTKGYDNVVRSFSCTR